MQSMHRRWTKLRIKKIRPKRPKATPTYSVPVPPQVYVKPEETHKGQPQSFTIRYTKFTKSTKSKRQLLKERRVAFQGKKSPQDYWTLIAQRALEAA